MFGLVVSNNMDAYSLSCAHCAPSAKNKYVLQKGHVEMDDSYIAERGCPLFPLLLEISQNHNRAPLHSLLVSWFCRCIICLLLRLALFAALKHSFIHHFVVACSPTALLRTAFCLALLTVLPLRCQVRI
jgi:hypothetical protein